VAFHAGLFAFAYPLAAIDYYDGYVDTTQSHSDNALIKRVSGDITEVLAPVLPIILIIVGEVALTEIYISQDNPVRAMMWSSL
jgi:hypothetical protein